MVFLLSHRPILPILNVFFYQLCVFECRKKTSSLLLVEQLSNNYSIWSAQVILMKGLWLCLSREVIG